MISLEQAKTIVEQHNDWPPMTDSPKANFLLDVAQKKSMDPVFGESFEASDWEDVKEEYQEEVEIYQRDGVDVEPYSLEQLKKSYL